VAFWLPIFRMLAAAPGVSYYRRVSTLLPQVPRRLRTPIRLGAFSLLQRKEENRLSRNSYTVAAGTLFQLQTSRRSKLGLPMENKDPKWEIVCQGELLAKCRRDPKFPYLVTLSRAVNAINSVTSILNHAFNRDTPAGRRDVWNSFLFVSAILYEGLKLVQKMNQAFADDERFQNGLRMLLKDKTAQRISSVHLEPVRNAAIFHFDPEWFAEKLDAAKYDKCVFVTAQGKKKTDLYHGFADEIALEIFIGEPMETEAFAVKLEDIMRDTTTLSMRFSEECENLIANTLLGWGFKMVKQSPA
jgi:hypothetical protein